MSKKVLIVSPQYIINNSLIEKNVSLSTISKSIIIAQEQGLKEILGDTLYNNFITAIEESVTSGSTLSDVFANILTYSKPYIVAKTIVEFLSLNQYKLTNKGILSFNDDSANAINQNELDILKNYYANLIPIYKKDLVKFLKNSNLIDYDNNVDITSEAAGWFFGSPISVKGQVAKDSSDIVDKTDYTQIETTYTYQDLQRLSKVLLITPTEVTNLSIIESNIDIKVLTNVITSVQNTYLKPILGDRLFNNLLDAIYEKSVNNTPLLPLYDDLFVMVKPFLINKVVAEFIMQNSFKFTKKGLLQMTDDSASTLNITDINTVKDYYDNLSTQFKIDLVKFLIKNKLTNGLTDENITSDATGWFIGNTKIANDTSDIQGGGGSFDCNYIADCPIIIDIKDSIEEIKIQFSGFSSYTSNEIIRLDERINDTNNDLNTEVTRLDGRIDGFSGLTGLTLQQVTNNGNTTTLPITASAFTFNNIATLRGSLLSADTSSIHITNIKNTETTNLSETNDNTIIGINAFGNGWNSTDQIARRGAENSVYGFGALSPFTASTTLSFNSVFGAFAGGNSIGNSNTFFGHSAGYGISGSNNIAIGINALLAINGNATGGNNIAIGTSALSIAGPGSNNIAIGVGALQGNPNATGNRINGSNNVILGFSAARNLNTGNDVIAIGREAARFNTLAQSITNLTNCIYIGATILATQNANNEIAIGTNGRGTNSLAIGNTNISNTYINGLVQGAIGYATAGGLATQFLKADGSLDSNTYLTSSSLPSNLVTGTGLTNSIAYWSSTSGLTANNKFIYNPTNGALIFGTDETGFATLGLPTNRTTLATFWEGGDGFASNRIVTYTSTSGVGSAIQLYTNRGTLASPLAAQTNNILGNLTYHGHNGTDWVTAGILRFSAGENWTSTASGSIFDMLLNTNGTNNLGAGFRFTPTVFRAFTDNLVDIGNSFLHFKTLFVNNLQNNGNILIAQNATSTNPTLNINGGDDLATTINTRFRNRSAVANVVIGNTGRTTIGGTSLPSNASDLLQVIGSAQFGDVVANNFEGIVRIRASQDAFFNLTRTAVRSWQIGINSGGSFVIRDRDSGIDRFAIDTNGRVGISTTPTHTLTLPSTSTGFVMYNTADQTTNFERLRLINTANTFTLISESNGVNTPIRPIVIGIEGTPGGGITRRLIINHISTTDSANFVFTNSSTSLIGSTIAVQGGLNGTQSQNVLTLSQTISQTVSGAINRNLFISPFYTSNSSTNNFLIDAGTNTAANAAGTHASLMYLKNNGAFRLQANTRSFTFNPDGSEGAINGTIGTFDFDAGLTNGNSNFFTFRGRYNNTANTTNFLVIAPHSTQTGTAGLRSVLISPFIQTSGSSEYSLVDIGTNTAADASGTHTSLFAIRSNGAINVATGTNRPIDRGTLVNGTITINNTLVTANSTIILTNIGPNSSTRLGTLNVGTITPGVSFVVNSLKHDSPSTIETNDVSTFRYWIIN
jgi:hypothetical protein